MFCLCLQGFKGEGNRVDKYICILTKLMNEKVNLCVCLSRLFAVMSVSILMFNNNNNHDEGSFET